MNKDNMVLQHKDNTNNIHFYPRVPSYNRDSQILHYTSSYVYIFFHIPLLHIIGKPIARKQVYKWSIDIGRKIYPKNIFFYII